MQRLLVQKVGVSSLGKLFGSVNGIVGLAIGLISSIVTTVSVISNNNYSVLTDIFAAVGIVLLGVVVYPLVLFAVGWLYGAIVALVINLFVGVSGGIELEVEEVKSR
jgi:CHASE2 domain-containing sensor protein